MKRVAVVTFSDPKGNALHVKVSLTMHGLTRAEAEAQLTSAIRAVPVLAMSVHWADFGVESMRVVK